MAPFLVQELKKQMLLYPIEGLNQFLAFVFSLRVRSSRCIHNKCQGDLYFLVSSFLTVVSKETFGADLF